MELRPGMLFDFALKLKSGVLVSRSPLFVGGKKIARADRKLTVYKPRRELKPGQIAADSAKSGDPQLAYRVTGKKQNEIVNIAAPRARTSGETFRNAVDGARIEKAVMGTNGSRFDKRGITSRTVADAHAHAANDAPIPTATLRRHYAKKGYEPDRVEMLKMLRGAFTPTHREAVRETLKVYTPLIRKPRPAQG